MKSIIKIMGAFFVGLLVLFILPAISHAADTGFSYNAEGSNATITGYTGSDSDVVIPNKIGEGEFIVAAIGENAFADHSDLTSIILPSGLVNIGDNAFYACSNLLKIYFKGDKPRFGMDVFSGAASGLKVYYPVGRSENWENYTDKLKQPYCNLTLDAKDGNTPASVTADVNDGRIIEPDAPAREGYTFGGWCTDIACTDKWDFQSDTVTDDMTLYAKWKEDESAFFGTGTEEEPYLIENEQDLLALASLVNAGNFSYADKYYLQSEDIDLSGYDNWTPIGSTRDDMYLFKGTYDGNAKIIKGMTISTFSQDEVYAGLFGCVKGIVKDLIVEDANIFVSGNGSGDVYAGAIAGRLEYGSIEDCSASGKISATGKSDITVYAGGLIGCAEHSCKISDCSFSGTAHGTLVGTAYAGGIIARMYGDITVNHCANTGSVYAGGVTANSGGIAGWSDSGTVHNKIIECYNTGKVRHRTSNSNNNSFSGGVVGHFSSTDIFNCYNSGPVIAESAFKGFDNGAGGIAGIQMGNGGVIRDSYNAGLVYGAKTGGISGEILGDAGEAIDNCYYIDTCPAAAGNGNGSAYRKTLEELKQPETYSGFDFDGVWTMERREDTKYSFPQLADNLFYARESNVVLTVDHEIGGSVQGSGEYTFYDNVMISAVPDKGYWFKNWTVASGAVALSGSTEATAFFPMPGTDVSIKAKFEKIKYTVVMQNDGNGTADGANAYTWGDTVSITAKPNPGYQFKNWEVISGDIDLSSIYAQASFTMPKSNVVIKANFELNPPYYTYTIDGSKAVITGYTGSEESITVPQRLGGYPVTEIGDYAFASCETVKHLDIQNGVVSIGDYVFASCRMLEKVNLPSSLAYIGNAVFKNCSKITSIDLPDSLTTMGYTFYLCTNLASVKIGKGLTNIKYDLFEGCPKLTQIEVDPGNPHLKSVNNVIYNKAGTALVYYPKGKLGFFAIPNGVTTIREYAFSECRLLTGVIIPQSVTTIEKDAFLCCTSLMQVDIPDSVETIAEQVFHGCEALKSVTLGKNMESIGYKAFFDCKSLKRIEIPRSVKSVGDSAFNSGNNCSYLEEIYFWGPKPEFGTDVFRNVPVGFKVYFHVGSANTWVNYSYPKQAFCLLTLDLKDGSAPTSSIEPLTYFHIIPEANPGRTGYTFSGWYKEAQCTNPWDFNTTVEKDVTLYAKWTANNYTVSFDPQGGVVSPSEKTVTYGNPYGVLPTPVKTGHTFGGWYTGKSGSGARVTKDSGVNTTGSRTLYAKWTVQTYTVKLDAQDGSVYPVSKTVSYGGTYGAMSDPIKAGHTFGGWYTQKNGQGTHVTQSSKVTITGNQTLYAKWTANTYTVKFSAQGGTVYPASKTVGFGSPYGTLPVPVKTGCTFKGWYTDINGGGILVTAASVVAIKENLILYAKWVSTISATPNKSSYGSVTGANTYNYGTLITLRAIPRSGYLFLKWTENGRTTNKNCVYQFAVMKNRTLEAEFAAIGKPELKSAASAGKGRITIKLKKAVTGVTGYYVYRSTNSKSGYKCVGKSTTTNYTDKGLVKGKKYYYKVKAYFIAGSVTTIGKSYSNVKSSRAGR